VKLSRQQRRAALRETEAMLRNRAWREERKQKRLAMKSRRRLRIAATKEADA
jgi:hypothetical protein